MALRAVLDSLDGLDPVIASEYTEKEGKFYLDLVEDTVRVHPHVLALKNAKDRQEAEARRFKRELQESTAKLESVPEDFNREEWDRLVSEEEGRKKNPDQTAQQLSTQREMYEQRIATQKADLESKIGEKTKVIETKELEIRTMKRDQKLNDVLTEVGVEDKALPAVKALLGPKIKVEFDKDTGEYSIFIPGDMGDQPVEQFVTNWAESDAGKFFIAKPSGGDANGGKGKPHFADGNPWLVKEGQRPNITKQQEMIVADANKARQMAIAAGVNPTW